MPFWTQRRADDFNLDPRFLTRAALTQPLYYSVRRYATVSGSDADAIEDVLASGREVVWGFSVGPTGQGQIVWRPCVGGPAKCEPRSGHAMLIVGYDRRDPDPHNHYFLAKNSWGPTQWPGGYTRISYEYLRTYGTEGGYITEVEPPRPWPELAFIGRWILNADDLKGMLDVYRIPGVSQWLIREYGGRGQDHRIGMFYDESGRAYRVNGRITADHIEFFIDPNNRNAHWDQMGGRRFVYSRPVDQVMTGWEFKPNGHASAGIATQGAMFADVSRTPRPFAASAFLGSWTATFLSPVNAADAPRLGILHLDRIDNTFLSAAERAKFDGLAGEFSDGETDRFEVHALIDRRTAPVAEDRTWEIAGYHLIHANGIVAGTGTNNGLEMILTRDDGSAASSIIASQATYGGSCGAAAGNMTGVLANACNGRDRCDYAIDYKTIGDPARGCRKGFAIEWRCTGSAGTHRLTIPAEAGLGSVAALGCKTSASTAAPNVKLSTH